MGKILITILFLLFPLILLSRQIGRKTDTIPPVSNIINLPQAKKSFNHSKENTKYQLQDEDPSQITESQDLATAKDILFNMNDLEREDWDTEARRKVRALYIYLGHIFDGQVSDGTRKEAVGMARDLFVKDSTIVFCDSVLIKDRRQITHHNVDNFFDKLGMLKLDSDDEIVIMWNVIHSNKKFESANILTSNITEFKAMKLTESIYVSGLHERGCSATKIVEIYFTIRRKYLHEQLVYKIKLGSISFSK